MALKTLIRTAGVLVVFTVCLYFGCLTILLNSWTQRHAIYLHKAQMKWSQDPNQPEQLGYLNGQVQPFYIRNPDGERLYGWHVLPLTLYVKHEGSILKQTRGPVEVIDQEDANSLLSLKLLMEDPEARLLINFHGNAGTVAQGWRTDTYRALTSLAGDKVHVLTIDYRGFGYSSGSPTETGVISDGVTLVKWATNMLGVPPRRIILVGQSLGTAVTTAVAEHLVIHDDIEIKNIVLVAAFTGVPSLLKSYKIGGYLPVLSPLNKALPLQDFYVRRIQDTWYTFRRLENIVKLSKDLNLQLIHAKNDKDIPYHQSESLFYTVANATSDRGMTKNQIDAVKGHRILRDGGFVSTWNTISKSNGKIQVRLEITPYGGNTNSRFSSNAVHTD